MFQPLRNIGFSFLQAYFKPSMFPVSKSKAQDIRKYESHVHYKDLGSLVQADCSREGIFFGVGGLVQDMRKALERRNKLGVEKFVVVVPRDYFTYHRMKKNVLGLMLGKTYKYKFFFRFGSVPNQHLYFL